MSNARKYPKWQRDSIAVIDQYMDSPRQATYAQYIYANGRWINKNESTMPDRCGERFLLNMRLVLLELDERWMSVDGRDSVELFLSNIHAMCQASTNALTRGESIVYEAFIEHVACVELAYTKKSFLKNS